MAKSENEKAAPGLVWEANRISWKGFDVVDEVQKMDLRKRVQNIRECLDEINGDVFSISYSPAQDFPDKNNYPLEFQIFMEEIGALIMSYLNVHVIEIHAPLLCDPIDEKFNETLSDSYLHNLKSLEDSLFIEAVNGSSNLEIKAKDYIVVGADCNVSTYGFYTGIKPYEFVTTYNLNPASNFIAWFKSLLNSDLEIELYEELGRDFF